MNRFLPLSLCLLFACGGVAQRYTIEARPDARQHMEAVHRAATALGYAARIRSNRQVDLVVNPQTRTRIYFRARRDGIQLTVRVSSRVQREYQQQELQQANQIAQQILAEARNQRPQVDAERQARTQYIVANQPRTVVVQPTVTVAPAGGICANTCASAHDGECDDGGPGSIYNLCAYGSDCNDCGVRTQTAGGAVVVTGGGYAQPNQPGYVPHCESLVVQYGHPSTSQMHCGGAEPYCAEALLQAGHPPTSLMFCRGVNPGCAVSFLQGGGNPTGLSRCR